MTKAQMVKVIQEKFPELAKELKASWNKPQVLALLERGQREERRQLQGKEATQKKLEDAMTAAFGPTFGSQKNYEDPIGRQEIQALRNSLSTIQFLLYHYEDLAQAHLMTKQMILRFTRILEAHFSGEKVEGIGPITQELLESELRGMFLWALQMKVKELK
jgi:hypothetical protein